MNTSPVTPSIAAATTDRACTSSPTLVRSENTGASHTCRGLVEVGAGFAGSGLAHAEALKYADRGMVHVEGLGPDLFKVQLLKAVSQSGAGGDQPEAAAPDGAGPAEEAELAAVRLLTFRAT